MISPIGMETFEARLESFNVVHSGTKKRTSNAKSATKLKWSHKSPGPAQLARAGFFYNPKTSAPDNTTCYLCHENLDGWEEDDNAIEEHANLSPGCGWAAIVRIEKHIEEGTSEHDDPMNEKLLDARRMTFGANWPHENKRGWICKTEKMVEGGWYYCPTPESDDLVRCCYCSLSLDGWESKDNPHDEHQRRSPDCVFFVLAASKIKKPARGRKGRGSKASRVSAQSNLTTASEDFSMVDVSNAIEASLMHNLESPGAKKVPKGAKKGTKGRKAAPKSRGKTAATQQEEIVVGSSFVEPEDDDFEVKILSEPVHDGCGMKRKSDEMSVDNESIQAGLTQFPLPSPKRRATRASASHENKDPISTLEFILDNDTYKEDNESLLQSSQAKGKKTAKGGRKRASSAVRKASTTSTATKASLRAAVPDDEEIDAALEADLDRPLTNDEEELEPPTLPKTKTRRLTKTRPGSRKATASTAPVRKTTRASTLLVEGDGMMNADTPMGNSHIEASQGTEALKIALNAVEHAKQEIIAETDKRTASKAKTRGRPPSKATKAIKEGEEKKSSEVDAAPLQGVVTEPNPKSQEATAPEDIQKPGEVPARPSPTPELPTVNNVGDGVAEIDSSVLAPPTSYDDYANETVAVGKSQIRVRGGGKTRANTAAKKSKATKEGPADVFEPEHVIPVEVEKSRRDRPGPVVELEIEHNDPVVEETTLRNQPRVEEIPHSVGNVPKPKKGRAAKAKARPGKPSMRSPFIEPKEPAEPSPTAPQNKVEIAEIISDETHDHADAISPRAATPHRTAPVVHGTPKTGMSPQSSDAENQPPSSRPSALRPPLTTQSPSKGQTTRVVLAASTPTAPPSKQNTSRLESTLRWTSTDFEKLFTASPAAEKEDFPSTMGKNAIEVLTSLEKKLTVEEWIHFNAQRGEVKLRDECERLVGRFEGEGVRALKTLEGIICAE